MAERSTNRNQPRHCSTPDCRGIAVATIPVGEADRVCQACATLFWQGLVAYNRERGNLRATHVAAVLVASTFEDTAADAIGADLRADRGRVDAEVAPSADRATAVNVAPLAAIVATALDGKSAADTQPTAAVPLIRANRQFFSKARVNA